MSWLDWVTLGQYSQWQREAEQITRSLGLVYTPQSIDIPLGKKPGDVLPASNNAITHAYVSAMIANLYGSSVSKYFGDWRELNQPPGPGEAWDSYKDLWNNEVGRRIGSSVGRGDVAAIITQAMRDGDLIVVRTDRRIPNNYVYSAEGVESFDTQAVVMRRLQLNGTIIIQRNRDSHYLIGCVVTLTSLSSRSILDRSWAQPSTCA